MNFLLVLTLAVLSATLPYSGELQAAESPPPANPRFFLGLGLTHGGEELAEIQVVYDYHNEDEQLRSGDLMALSAGLLIPLPLPALSLQTSIGYHFDRVSADSDEVKFDRIPLELIGFYSFDQHRIGTGFSYHLDPELDLKDAGGPRVEFDDALGVLLEYDYSFSGWHNSGLVLGVRYLWIDYDIDQINGISVNDDSIDGSHVGVQLNFLF